MTESAQKCRKLMSTTTSANYVFPYAILDKRLIRMSDYKSYLMRLQRDPMSRNYEKFIGANNRAICSSMLKDNAQMRDSNHFLS